MTWEDLKDYENYEINTEYPYQIRNKQTKKIIKESFNNCRYVQINLKGVCKTKHSIIAKQWIPNPDNLKEVNHINKQRNDNRIENLEWTTRKKNLEDRERYKINPYEYLKDLPENAYKIEEYKNNNYNKYWLDIDNDKIIIYCRGKYHYLTNNRIINIIDNEGKRHTTSIKKFIKYAKSKLE